ncbi:MAG: Phosphoenolpyruvate-protein phosphotransferase [Puniceicoccaceae bacterium MED-G32]|nr:MAG: Phosphoenolpyruvate-protein phosphotransferase [Puniceicoccaceae bacterium MED-G32]|tara:strand:+ start:941 stop:2671 length:1731 start_codon:yes stop_codon:yes gene_type:complete
MTNHAKEIVLKGIPASPGICHGDAMLFAQINIDVPLYRISENEVSVEKERFQKAILATREEIIQIRDQVSNSLGEDEALIFDAHLMVLEDNALITETIQHIEQNKQNVEYSFNVVVERYINFFKTIEDEYLRERVSDIKDVSRRVLNHLVGATKNTSLSTPQNRIIVSEDITPSQAVSFNKDNLLGFITDSGGATSHFVIMSRSFKIPAVVGLHNATEKIKQNDYILIDGYEGLVFINPSAETIKEYDQIANKQREIERSFQEELVEKTETLDGHSIELMANIEASDDISASIQDSFDGIGLFRTESIYLMKNGMPSEEEQFNEYASVVKNTNGKPVIIRTLDIGGDKLINGVHDDSFLGLRAIRFCLENLTIFKTQLRAILRASIFGDIRIMYPMISGVEELDKANYILDEVKEELLAEEIAFDSDIQVGAMIELPSAVSIIDLLANKVDFFSVGTNDLIQYLMAVDRMDDRVSHLYQPTHPAVLRSLKSIFEQSDSNQKHVSVCGEMAGEPIYAALLIGLGAKSLSVSVSRLPEIKHYIRLMNLGELKELINELMTLDQADPIEQKLKAFIEKL